MFRMTSATRLPGTHNRVEGRTLYIQLLYLPERAPLPGGTANSGMAWKLYVKRVFIMEYVGALL